MSFINDLRVIMGILVAILVFYVVWELGLGDFIMEKRAAIR